MEERFHGNCMTNTTSYNSLYSLYDKWWENEDDVDGSDYYNNSLWIIYVDNGGCGQNTAGNPKVHENTVTIIPTWQVCHTQALSSGFKNDNLYNTHL